MDETIDQYVKNQDLFTVLALNKTDRKHFGSASTWLLFEWVSLDKFVNNETLLEYLNVVYVIIYLNPFL